MPQPPEPLAATNDVTVWPAISPARLREVADRLDAAETAMGSPLVDEAERARLDRAVRGELAPGEQGWQPALAWSRDRVVGYLAVVTEGDDASGDAAVLTAVADDGPAASLDDTAADHAGVEIHDVEVLGALLEGAQGLAAQAGSSALQVWTRRGGQPQIEAAHQAGFTIARRLGVLGRPLEPASPPPPAPAATIREVRPGLDDVDVVEVLAEAYAGTDEAGWDAATFAERTRLAWYRPEDLLVAERDTAAGGPRLGGLHWLKRRDETTGEVYNLAVHPAAQGEGLGPTLLHAGLTHLREQGLDEVILWVDLANERAVRLYHAQGFETRWLDLALSRVVGEGNRSSGGPA